MTRVAFLTNSPAPYRDQLAHHLAARYESFDLAYTHPAAEDRAWATDPVPPGGRLPVLLRAGHLGNLNRGVVRLVRRHDVVVVGGYEQPSYMLAIVAARMLRRRLVVLFDGIAPSRIHPRPRWRTALKAALVQRAHVCLVNGSTGHRYFHDVLGVPHDRLQNQYLVPVEVPRPAASTSSRCDVLFVGRLIERKGVRLLVEALRGAPDLTARIVGGGPLADELARATEGTGIQLVGELPVDEVAVEMAAARCLVVPSVDEPWGLVVHEALKLDLPVVVSNDLGCGDDLVVDGANATVCDPLDAPTLATAIRRALALDTEVVRSTNRQILSIWNLESHVRAFRSAIDGCPADEEA